MLLKSIKLNNIRSYSEQLIEFPLNSTLLSGDIGCGKSTLLLALEFALFGISKPNLTGETLLRKGTIQGSVELSFNLNNQDICIKRNLKKSKDNIVQKIGSLTINQITSELTPVELKTKIIKLINYPSELVYKNKNYIFRYTVYCPQEEMKLILQENPDNRLDILRKIFNLDKYKRIRENLDIYFKEIKKKSLILKTKIEPWEEKNLELKGLREKQKQFEFSLNLVLPQLEKIQKELNLKKREIDNLEGKNKLHLEIKNKLTNSLNWLKDKEGFLGELINKKDGLEMKISKLNVIEEEPLLKLELENLEKKHQENLTNESELKTKINYCQEQVKSIQEEFSVLNEQVGKLTDKKEKFFQLTKEVSKKDEIQEELELLNLELNELKDEITHNKLLKSQAEEIKNKIVNLKQCPTCFQEVTAEYKKNIFQEQETKLSKIINSESIFQEKLNQLLEKQKKITNQCDDLTKKETDSIKLKTEIDVLVEKEDIIKNKKEKLEEFVIENNQLIQKLSNLDFSLKDQIQEKRDTLQKLMQKKEFGLQLGETKKEIVKLKEQILKLEKEKKENEEKITLFPEQTIFIEEEKGLLEEISEKEKLKLTEKAKLLNQLDNLKEQINRLVDEINLLSKSKKYLVRLTEISHWLEEFMIKVTYTIEKQVMLRIHYLFNDLFNEWFSILVDDGDFSARLDDSFTPVIEQDGYEITFNNLSGGERTAASLSYRLALNKVINEVIHEIKTKELLILDEPTDGFSSEQLDKVRDVLDRLNLQQTLIVSHESKIESFVENVVRIEKKGNISKIL